MFIQGSAIVVCGRKNISKLNHEVASNMTGRNVVWRFIVLWALTTGQGHLPLFLILDLYNTEIGMLQ